MNRKKIIWYLYFSKQERRAALLLFSLQAVLVAIAIWPSNPPKYELDEQTRREWMAWQQEQAQQNIPNLDNSEPDRSVSRNHLADSLPKRIAGNSKPEEEYIDRIKPTSEKVIIWINEADTLEWQALRGIGPYYAHRICRFREALGGFVSVEQVGETYNLPDSVFRKIKPQLQCRGEVRKILVNSVGASTLAKHPYIYWNEAKMIERYRVQHGEIRDSISFGQIKSINNSRLKKMIPYLDFSPVDTVQADP